MDKVSKMFWDEKVQWKNNGDVTEKGLKVIRCKGKHYVAGPETSEPNKYKGFSGAEFKFKFIDGPHKGQEITTTNLWYQGVIPEEYREELPDNAVCIPTKVHV